MAENSRGKRLFHTLLDGRRGIGACEITVMPGLSGEDIRGGGKITIPAPYHEEIS
ncbi:hypothetical protein ACQP1W_26310 [Spirillospora sp. CA-255316]